VNIYVPNVVLNADPSLDVHFKLS